METTAHETARTGGARPRTTRQRTAILETLGRQEDFRSAQQIHEQMRSGGASVGLATVYRNLQTLAEAGQVDVLVTDEGESIYRQCAATVHHHHLVCRVCGRTVEFEAPQVETWTREMAASHGFTAIEHTMEIFGLCPEHSDGEDPQNPDGAAAEASA